MLSIKERAKRSDAIAPKGAVGAAHTLGSCELRVGEAYVRVIIFIVEVDVINKGGGG